MISGKNLINNSFQVFAAVLLLSACAATKFRIEQTNLDKYLELSSVFAGSHSGLLVYDPESESVLFDYHADKKFVPASNNKLLTYYAMISMLGDSIQGMNYCVSGDTLYFTGTGDPTLLYGDFSYATTFDYLSNHNGPLVYIEKVMKDTRLGPGWAWDDYPYYYSAERSPFPIYGNMVRFASSETKERILVMPDHFKSNVLQVYDNEVDVFSIERKEMANEYLIKLAGDTVTVEDEVPFIYSNKLFIQLLSDTLHRPVTKADRFPDCKIETLYSVATDSVAKNILTISDNFLSEQMLLLISNQFGDTLVSSRSIEYMLENEFAGIQDEIHWVDGSGLSRYNLVSPRAMVHVLNKIQQSVPKQKLYHLLPESGSSGTLTNSFSELGGRIHAKTGSMSHVYNLSGYLETNSGKTLLFSFMNNNFTVSFDELKAEMQRVLSLFVND